MCCEDMCVKAGRGGVGLSLTIPLFARVCVGREGGGGGAAGGGDAESNERWVGRSRCGGTCNPTATAAAVVATSAAPPWVMCAVGCWRRGDGKMGRERCGEGWGAGSEMRIWGDGDMGGTRCGGEERVGCCCGNGGR